MARTFDKWMTDADRYVQDHIFALEANTVNELFAEYQRALANMAISLDTVASRYGTGETWNYSDAKAQERTQALVDALMDEMRRLTGKTSQMTLDAATKSYFAGLYGRAWIADTLSKGIIDIPVLPVEAVRAAILAPYKGNTFVERFKTSDDEFQRRIRTSIVQSQINGETMYQAQKRIAAELGLDISRRTKAAKASHKNDFNRTNMIARTEMIRASSLGSLAIYEQNKDILIGWRSIAAKDERVCPECGELDGQEFLFTQHRTPPPYHVMCRCSTTPVFKENKYNEFIKANVPTFKEWAIMRGINQNIYGQTFDLKPQKPPKSPQGA